MKYREFKVFIGHNGEDEINDWLNSMPSKFRAHVRNVIIHLEITEDMRCKYFEGLTRYRNLYELRFKYDNIQYRPLGCLGPGKDEFIILFIAKEIGDKFVPKDAPKRALERFKLVQTDRRYVGDFV